VAELSDQININVVQSLLLARDPLGEDIVNEPGQVDILLLLLLFLLGLFLFSRWCFTLGWLLVKHKLFNEVQILFEIVPSRIVALELDLIDDLLRGKGQA
jgi:hypothetical protein